MKAVAQPARAIGLPPPRCEFCRHCVVEAVVVPIGETQHPDELTCTVGPVWQSVTAEHWCGQWKARS